MTDTTDPKPAPALPEGWKIEHHASYGWRLRERGRLVASVFDGLFEVSFGDEIPAAAIRALLDAAERGTT